MRIEIVGTIFGTTGYDVHTRYIANTLYLLNDGDVNLNIPLTPNWESQVNDNEMKMLSKPFIKDYVMIFIGQPQTWRFGLSNKPTKFYGYVIWEGDRVPLYWLEYLADKRVNGIFVPSNHVKEAIINTINTSKTLLEAQGKEILDKIYIIPHGVDLSHYSKDYSVFKPFNKIKMGERKNGKT